MAGDSKKERAALGRLADALVEDIINTSDEDILAEFRETHGDPEKHATEMRALFEKSLTTAEQSLETPLTSKQYRAALAALGLSQGQAAEFLGVGIRTAHGYANDRPIPEAVAKLLRVMVQLKLSPEDVP